MPQPARKGREWGPGRVTPGTLLSWCLWPRVPRLIPGWGRWLGHAWARFPSMLASAGEPPTPRARVGPWPQPCSPSFRRGSAYASTMSYFVQTIFLFLYIVLKKLHLETWAGAEGRPAFGGLSRQASGRTLARAQGVHLAGGQKTRLQSRWRGPVSGLASTSLWGLLPLCSTPQDPAPKGPRSPPIKCDMVQSPAFWPAP